jgi:hypothetical protein
LFLFVDWLVFSLKGRIKNTSGMGKKSGPKQEWITTRPVKNRVQGLFLVNVRLVKIARIGAHDNLY